LNQSKRIHELIPVMKIGFRSSIVGNRSRPRFDKFETAVILALARGKYKSFGACDGRKVTPHVEAMVSQFPVLEYQL
jgi:hypothetical protein